MKIVKLSVLCLSLFLTACNTLQQKSVSHDAISVGEYKIQLEMADKEYVKKDYQKALERYQQIHANFSRDTYVLFRMGNIYSHLKQPKKAIDAYEKALSIDKSMGKAWYNLGVIHMKQSANTWQQMSKYVDREDPLYSSARHYSLGMSDLIKPQ